MNDDIVARLRLSPVLMYSDQLGQSRIDYEACKKFINNEGVKMMREAADEIERLRKQVEHHARDRVEYCDAWSKWIEENDGLDIAEWCRAYADAVPYPNPDGPNIVLVIHSRLDARHRMAANEIERLRVLVQGWEHSARNAERDIAQLREERDEARRLWCVDIGELYSSSSLSLAKERGWDCFKENKP